MEGAKTFYYAETGRRERGIKHWRKKGGAVGLVVGRRRRLTVKTENTKKFGNVS